MARNQIRLIVSSFTIGRAGIRAISQEQRFDSKCCQTTKTNKEDFCKQWQKSSLLPRKEYLDLIYDPRLGTDKWLIQQ